MFLGHLAVGFAAKRAVPRTSLAVLVLATQLADTLWPAFVGAGLEQVAIEPGITAVTPLDFVSYPYSHSLVLLTAWGLLFGWIVGHRGGAESPTLRPARLTSPIVVLAALVVSHWVLDFVTHRPDLPLYPGSARYGLGLWNSVPGTLTFELAMWAAGVWVYVNATRPKDRFGRWGLAALVGFLTMAYFGNIFGPPPPSVDAIWMGALVAIPVLTLWAWWADRHRAMI